MIDGDFLCRVVIGMNLMPDLRVILLNDIM